MLKVNGVGPLNAEVMIVGEAPGFEEEIAGRPFVGPSGFELGRQLRECGIDIADCYLTNVCKYRPPGNDMQVWSTDKKKSVKKLGYTASNGRYVHPLVVEGATELQDEIERIKPKLVIGLGNTALWALTGKYGVTNWRGSQMIAGGFPFVPTLHPAAVLRNWAQRPNVIADLKRAFGWMKRGFEVPEYDFNIYPTFLQVIEFLEDAEKLGRWKLAADIETAKGKIVCLGLAISPTKALCIPMYNEAGVYWHDDDLQNILRRIRKLSQAGKILWTGQNWNYDAQYFEEDFGWTVMAGFDTYIAQSVLWPGQERGLGYLSSVYCDYHLYWKEDAKDWGKIADFPAFFRYNCMDCCRTWEIAGKQMTALFQYHLYQQFEERMRYSHYVYRMMRRGVNRDEKRTAKMLGEVSESIQVRELAVSEAAGHPVNFKSPLQVGKLLFNEMGLESVGRKTAKGKASTDDEALTKLMEKNPNAAVVCMPILEARSLATLRANFLEAECDPDGKFRSSWMATGAETFRLTSGGNAFHRGGPLQNVTDGKHTSSGRPLPNLRSTIVPSPGCTIFNCDLERADLQVVAWEAEDEPLKAMLREHVDIHTQNAADLLGIAPEAVTEQQRHMGKKFVHLTNYGGKERTCAVGCHITVHAASLYQKRWFEMHPGIKRWHDRTQAFLNGTRTIHNSFGYRRVYFDRIDGVLPQALAWLPQSSIGILISLQHMAIEDACPELKIIMQGHDSIIGEYRTELESELLPRIQAALHIAIPYPDPLYIPLELATSTSSWGEVEKRAWPIHG